MVARQGILSATVCREKQHSFTFTISWRQLRSASLVAVCHRGRHVRGVHGGHLQLFEKRSCPHSSSHTRFKSDDKSQSVERPLYSDADHCALCIPYWQRLVTQRHFHGCTSETSRDRKMEHKQARKTKWINVVWLAQLCEVVYWKTNVHITFHILVCYKYCP
jgi:hypothetical protein